MARPMPRLAPVMMATRSRSADMVGPSGSTRVQSMAWTVKWLLCAHPNGKARRIFMKHNELLNRRSLLRVAGAGVVGVAAARLGAEEPKTPVKVNGNIKQSICRWCYGKIPLGKLAAEAARMGYKSIELLTPKEYLDLKPSGLTCAMIGGVSIADGFNRKENHEKLLKDLRDKIEFAAAEGL